MRSVEVVKQLWRELPCLDGKGTWGVKSVNHLSLKNTRNLFTPHTIDNASLSMCVCVLVLSPCQELWRKSFWSVTVIGHDL